MGLLCMKQWRKTLMTRKVLSSWEICVVILHMTTARYAVVLMARPIIMALVHAQAASGDYYPTPEECDKCLCKPAGGKGVRQIAPSGYKGCCSTPSGKEKDLFFAYGWVPPCDSKGRACMPQCIYRVHRMIYGKTMCFNLGKWGYSYGLRTQNPRCKKPRRNCNYNDHPRGHFYRAIGIARNCKPYFNTGVIRYLYQCSQKRSHRLWQVHGWWQRSRNKASKAVELIAHLLG